MLAGTESGNDADPEGWVPGCSQSVLGLGQWESSLLQNSHRGGIRELGKKMCVQRGKLKTILFIGEQKL